MIPETPNLQRRISQGEERYTNLIKQEFIKHAKEINKLEKDFDYKYYTKDEVDRAISEALADLLSTSADIIESLDDIGEVIDGKLNNKLDKDSANYVKGITVNGDSIVVVNGDNSTSEQRVQAQIPNMPTKTSDLINDNGYITSVSWNEVKNKPNFAMVATSASYTDLYDTPFIPKKTSELTNDSGYITGVSWDEVTSKPTFATVATSGSYTDLSNKPTIPTIPTNVSAFNNDSGYITEVSWDDILNKPSVLNSITWNDITDKPSTFPPSTHNHNNQYPIINWSGMTSIASNTDLNTLKTPGTYFTTGGNGGSTVHASLSNSPTGGSGGGFMMYVIAEGSEGNIYPKQVLYMYNGDIYERTYGSSSWGEWHKRAYTDSDITGNAATATTATNANALNNLYTVSTRPTSANTCYADGKLRVYLATSTMTTGKPPTDAQILHLAWDNSKYDSQIAVSTGSNGDLYWRTQKGSDTWGEWQTAAKSGHTHSYLPLSGGTLTGTLQLGTSSQSQFPTTGIAVHDTRSVNATPGAMDKGVNFFFSNNTMPNTNWWAGMRVKGWTGAYSAWEVVGAAHNSDQKTLPLYVRTSNRTTEWGSWRKIYDSSNKPTLSELGAAASSHTHNYAGSSSSGGAATSIAIEAGTTDADRYVWFSYAGTGNEGKACYDANFKYNPSTNNLTVTKINGVAVGSSPKFTNTDTKVTNTAVAPTTETTYYITGSTASATETGELNKSANFSFKIKNGTTSAEGYTTLGLGNNTATGAANNQTGRIYMYNNKGKYTYIYPHAGDTENRTVYLPKSGGTLVAHTTDTAIGSASKPVYISASGVATACTSLETAGNMVMNGTANTNYLQLPSGIKLY